MIKEEKNLRSVHYTFAIQSVVRSIIFFIMFLVLVFSKEVKKMPNNILFLIEGVIGLFVGIVITNFFLLILLVLKENKEMKKLMEGE